MDFEEDDMNLGEYLDNRDLFSQPNPENVICESLSLGESQPISDNHTSQPNEVESEPADLQEDKGKKRKLTSNVWVHFKIEKRDIGGGKKENKAVCNYCKTPMTYGKGNGHLNRHAEKCYKLHVSKGNPTQSSLGRKADGSISTFKYTHARMREGLAKFLAGEELPFLLAESPRLERFMREYCQPEFKRVPRNTNKNDLLKVYAEEKKKLVNFFSNFKGSIAITSDLWSGRNNLPIMCVTAHYIDDNWMLHKKIIAFRLLEYPHTGRTIFNGMMDVFKEYNIVDKNFSVTFDNATNNTAAIDQLKLCLRPPYGGIFFHQRCACHVINLMCQDGMKLIAKYIAFFRDAIGYVSSSDYRTQDFKALCKSQGLKPRKFKRDMPIRWNSTYHMLNSCRDYTNALSIFYNDKNDKTLLTEDMWTLCFKFVDFLKVFYDATCNLSGVYYPTSPIALNDLYAITLTFVKYKSEFSIFKNICEVMEEKYKKYWEEIPFTFCFGPILDPRIKLNGLEVILHEIERNLSITLPLKVSTIQKNFNDTYMLYEKKYAAASAQSSQASHHASSSISNASGSQAVFGLIASKTKQTGVVRSCNEFFKYLDTDFTEYMTDEEKLKLDILVWWKGHYRNFPVLSIMARDFLTTPVSTVASESAFSAGGRVLDEKRTRLTPKNLEALMCVKDWDDAYYRVQSFVDEDLACDEEDQKNTSSIPID